MTSAPTIDFEWWPSRGWRRFRISSLLVGMACLAWAAVDAWMVLALLLLIALVEIRAGRSERAWAGSCWRVDAEGVWHWQRVDGVEGEATLDQATVLGPLIVLNLRADNRRVSLPLWPDTIREDTRRQLRIRLPTLQPAEPEPASPAPL